MRAAIIVTLFLLLASQSYSQAGPNDIVIIKYDWTKERIDWAGDPLKSSTETYGEMRDRVRTERRRVSALEERSTRATKEEQKKPEKPPRYIFRYVLTVHNTGLKTVSEIDWDFMFADAASGLLLGKREFTSVEKIGPGKKKQLSILASAPPTQTISVYSLGSNEREGLAPSVIILRVQYDDGTVWTPAN